MGRSHTVRFRLTALATLLVAGSLVLASVAIVVVQREVLMSSLDDGLRQRADTITASLGQAPVDDLLATSDPDDRFTQLVDAGGVVVAATAGSDRSQPIDESAPDDTDRIRTVDAEAFPEGPYRVLSRAIVVDGRPVTLHVVQTQEDVGETIRALALTFMIIVPLLAAFLGWLAWWLTGRALQPVEAIRSEVADIDGRGLHRRVPEPATGDEIDRLARTMNAMLERVENASRQQQQFVADASHELRSPLTRIRSELEVDLAHPEGADLSATHRTVLADAAELEALVDDLLFLARADADVLPTEFGVVDLDDLVLAEAGRLRQHTAVTVDIGGVSAAQVVGDRRQLARVVRNLADNARRHAEGEVSFRLWESDGTATLIVGDDGRGVDPGDRVRIFERFTRLDDARSRDAGGSGLGLAIVKEIILAHDGKVEVADGQTASGGRQGATFVVSLPTAPV